MNEIVHPYVPTAKWREIHASPAKYKVIVAGRRGGKSTGLLNHVFQGSVIKPAAKSWLVGPTYQQMKDIYWYDEKMKMYITAEAVEKKNESEMLIKLVNKSLIQFKGAERPDQLVGSGLDFLGMDEVAKIKSWHIVWEQNLRPALADKGGDAFFISTPQGKNHFFDLYEYAKSSGDPQWAAWKIPTWESGAPWTLTPEGKLFLENERVRMTEDTFMQEYGAEFRQFAGLVFKDFDRSTHVEEFEVNEKYAMECGMDFGNPKPTAFLFTYFDENDELWVFDEYYKVGALMMDHVGEILAKRNQYHNGLRWVVGDSAATQQIQECNHHGLYVTPVSKFHDSIQIGIDRIGERMRVNPITKRPTIHIHERCGNLIDELERYKWKEEKASGDFKESPEEENNHAIDALRYIIIHHRKKVTEKRLSIGRKYKPRSLRDSI
jgi:hypothetical protein